MIKLTIFLIYASIYVQTIFAECEVPFIKDGHYHMNFRHMASGTFVSVGSTIELTCDEDFEQRPVPKPPSTCVGFDDWKPFPFGVCWPKLPRTTPTIPPTFSRFEVKTTTEATSVLTKEEKRQRQASLGDLAANGDLDELRRILNEPQWSTYIDINYRGYGKTFCGIDELENTPALVIASACDQSFYMIGTLLNKGANVTARDSWGWDALVWAIARGASDTVQTLLNNGASVNARTPAEGFTPLLVAASNGQTQIAETLLDKNANIEARGVAGDSAILRAAKNGQTDTVQLLIDRGARINDKDFINSFTPIMWAAANGHADTVDLLRSQGADVTGCFFRLCLSQ